MFHFSFILQTSQLPHFTLSVRVFFSLPANPILYLNHTIPTTLTSLRFSESLALSLLSFIFLIILFYPFLTFKLGLPQRLFWTCGLYINIALLIRTDVSTWNFRCERLNLLIRHLFIIHAFFTNLFSKKV